MATGYLGIDFGDARIGVAASDSLGMMAFGIGYIPVKGGAVFAEIDRLLEEYEASCIVVGLPLSMKGTDTDQTRKTRDFVERLQKHLADRPVRVETWDERLTTAQAERALLEGNVRRKKRKELKDQLAAAMILQGYLDCARP